MPVTLTDIELEQIRREEARRANRPPPRQLRGVNKAFAESTVYETMLSGPAETGKAQPLDATVYTPSGPRRMGDLAVGDWVLTPDGGRAQVAAIYPQGMQPVYRVAFAEGESVECTPDHLWKVGYESRGVRPERERMERWKVIPCSELQQEYRRAGGRRKFWIPLTAPVDFDPRPLRIDPYVMGVLIGDGGLTAQVVFTSADPELVETVRQRLPDQHEIRPGSGLYAYRISRIGARQQCPATSQPGYVIPRGDRYVAQLRRPGGIRPMRHGGVYDTRAEAQQVIEAHRPFAFNDDERNGRGMVGALHAYGLMGKGSVDKFVPDDYLYNTADVRREVLQGLLDTDGTVDSRTGSISFSSLSPTLSAQVKWLVESLGGVARIIPRPSASGKIDHRVRVSLDDSASLFKLTRKRDRTQPRSQYPVKRMIADITYVGEKECQCIAVDHPDRLYLTDHFAVTHNTFAACMLMHHLLSTTKRARGVMLRKTYNSLIATVHETYKTVIEHSDIKAIPYGGERPQWYDYPNGSRLYLGGMDNAQKVLSGERDFIYFCQAEEASLHDWETLTTRATGRAGATDQPRVFGDCNPGPPTHWIINRPSLTVFESRHIDNPRLYDEAGQVTAAGARTMGILEALTGILRERLYLGRWVAAEGLVYRFDRAIHLIDPIPIPPEWPRFRAIDFGYTNPFVTLWIARDPDNRFHVYRQHYKTQMLVSDHAQVIKAAEGWDTDTRERIQATLADHDAEDRATLAAAGIGTQPGPKAVRPGIEALETLLKLDPTRRPRLYVHRDSLMARDEALQEARQPTCLEQEFDLYAYPKAADGKPNKEAPIKMYDHALDPLRYFALWHQQTGGGGGAGLIR
mgnify:FL=1